MNLIDRDITHNAVARMMNLDIEGRAHVAYWTIRDGIDDAHENDYFMAKNNAYNASRYGQSFVNSAKMRIAQIDLESMKEGGIVGLCTSAVY